MRASGQTGSDGTVAGYYVPTDPMDDLHCESCQ
jgi:hypothetical protein